MLSNRFYIVLLAPLLYRWNRTTTSILLVVLVGALTLVLPYRFCLAFTLYASLSEHLSMYHHSLPTFIPSTYTIIASCTFLRKSTSARLPYILIMLFVYKCYNLCESFFSIDTLLLQIYDVSCCISMSYEDKK